MEIQGKIIQVLPLQQGTSQRTGNPWALQSYVLETIEQYPRKVCFEVFGSDRIQQFACKEGDEVTVSFDIESREFNGRWYTSIRAWRVQHGLVAATTPTPTATTTATATTTTTPTPTAQQQTAAAASAAPAAANTSFDSVDGDNEDLPF